MSVIVVHWLICCTPIWVACLLCGTRMWVTVVVAGICDSYMG